MNASRWCECRGMGVVGGKLGWERATGRWRKNNLFFWWRGMMSKSRLARCQRNSRTRMSQQHTRNQRCCLMMADTLILPLVELLWDGGSAILPFLCLPPKNSKMRRYGWKRVRSEDYDDSESALSGVSEQPVEILFCHNCHRNFREPSIQIELDLDAYPICRVVVTNVTVQPWAFHRKFSTIRSSQ